MLEIPQTKLKRRQRFKIDTTTLAISARNFQATLQPQAPSRKDCWLSRFWKGCGQCANVLFSLMASMLLDGKGHQGDSASGFFLVSSGFFLVSNCNCTATTTTNPNSTFTTATMTTRGTNCLSGPRPVGHDDARGWHLARQWRPAPLKENRSHAFVSISSAMSSCGEISCGVFGRRCLWICACIRLLRTEESRLVAQGTWEGVDLVLASTFLSRDENIHGLLHSDQL